MKKLAWTVVALVGLATWLQAQGSTHYKELFWQQVSETCRPGLKWTKSVTEIEGGKEKTETKTFDLDCYKGTARSDDQTIPILPDEFAHLFEFMFDNPYYAPYLDVVRKDGGILATVKAGEEGQSKLRLQRFELHATSAKLRLAEAHILKSSALYDLEVHIQVFFDVNGHYLRHEIETKTDVLLGGSLHTIIRASLDS